MSEELKFRDFANDRIDDLNVEERTFSHKISDESEDSHGSIIKADGWVLKRFKKNPVVLLAHDHHGLPIANSRRVFVEGKNLMARTQFAGLDQGHPVAETAFLMATAEPKPFIRGWSVGFRGIESESREDLSEEEKWKLWDPVIYTKSELFEYSLVPIPSNPNALSKARDAGLDINPMIEWIAQQEQLVRFYTRMGLKIPGVNDKIEIEIDPKTGVVTPPEDPKEREPEEEEDQGLSQLRDNLHTFIIEEEIGDGL